MQESGANIDKTVKHNYVPADHVHIPGLIKMIYQH